MNEAVIAELRAEMARQNLTRSDLAAKLGKVPMWVSRRLNGETRLTFDDADLICTALGVSLTDITAAADAASKVGST